MRVALDTNVLAYAEGVNGLDKRDRIVDLLERLSPGTVVVPVQVLGELFNVLVRKAGRTPAEARETLLSWTDTFARVPTTPEVMAAAVDLATDHRLSIWDATILAAASHGGCRLLLSEDMQDGFTWAGVTVANPFAPVLHATLAALLDVSDG
ncbi:PIN domain-containing protein [uncultured Alsobacter sp.]|uniref:PIN domain-containing protein n=1 Tax=uncultured Alsobacter sp. TaxID=1748258 RepID=UPI0025F4A6F3|nr:PIN domain-containing protein [uncultured Alsobacter sp.]